MKHIDFRGNVWDCGIGNIEPHYKDIEYYGFTYMIPKYKIQPPDDFCEYYQTHKDEIIIELDKKNKTTKKEIERLNNIINELTQENLKRSDEIDNLLEIKNKATEYIKDYFYIDEETGEYYQTHTFDTSNLYELLKILDKGE